jgi:hypothetical protein
VTPSFLLSGDKSHPLVRISFLDVYPPDAHLPLLEASSLLVGGIIATYFYDKNVGTGIECRTKEVRR